MQKMKLNLDQLKVESFETVYSKEEKGTVNGQAPQTAMAYCQSELAYYCESGGYYCTGNCSDIQCSRRTCGPLWSCNNDCNVEVSVNCSLDAHTCMRSCDICTDDYTV